VQKSTFISYFTEGIELMKAAWSDEPKVTFHGQFRDVDDLPISPKPVFQRSIADIRRRMREAWGLEIPLFTHRKFAAPF